MEFVSTQVLDDNTPANSDQLDIHEEMVTLYQNIDHLLYRTPKRTIQFCGSRSTEGTTTIAREFANVASEGFGKSVLIIDGNIRSLDQCKFFGVSPSLTLLDVIRNTQLQVCDAFYKVKVPNITLSALAKPEPTLYGVFDTKSLRDLFERLKEQFDLIIIDSAPVLSSVESISVSSSVDGVVLVMEAETTRWRAAKAAKNKILGNGGNILGIVLNKRKYYTPEFIYRLF